MPPLLIVVAPPKACTPEALALLPKPVCRHVDGYPKRGVVCGAAQGQRAGTGLVDDATLGLAAEFQVAGGQITVVVAVTAHSMCRVWRRQHRCIVMCRRQGEVPEVPIALGAESAIVFTLNIPAVMVVPPV